MSQQTREIAVTINVGLLDEIIEHIEAHPEEWDQNIWGQMGQECKTTYCVAGHIVARTKKLEEQVWGPVSSDAKGVLWLDAVYDGGVRMNPGSYASKVLNIPLAAGDLLFYSEND